jgi:hypothetical protein
MATSRSARFVGTSGAIQFPETAKKIPKCLQPGFRPSKSVAEEFAAHGCHVTRDFGDDRLTALAKYTENDAYDDINKKMRAYSHKEWENTVFYLNEGIKALPKPRGRRPILWRGMDAVKVCKGQKIMFKDFTSCTKSRVVAQRFAGESGALFEIRTWSLGADIQRLSRYPGEEEILLAPYAQFIVTEIRGRTIVLDAC